VGEVFEEASGESNGQDAKEKTRHGAQAVESGKKSSGVKIKRSDGKKRLFGML